LELGTSTQGIVPNDTNRQKYAYSGTFITFADDNILHFDALSLPSKTLHKICITDKVLFQVTHITSYVSKQPDGSNLGLYTAVKTNFDTLSDSSFAGSISCILAWSPSQLSFSYSKQR